MKNLSFYILVASVCLAQPRIESIEFYGNTAYKASTIANWFAMDAGEPFAENKLQNAANKLLQTYASNGYYYCTIDSILYHIAADSSTVDIDIHLYEGEKISQGEIHLYGVSEAKALHIREKFDTRSQKPMHINKLTQDLEAALVQNEKAGYPFTKINIDGFRLDSTGQQLDMFFNISEGPKLTIAEFQFIGNELTKNKVIERESRFKPGQIFDYNLFRKIQPRLMRTGYFSTVQEPQLYWLHDNLGGILINVKEAKTSKFDGVVGYTPGTDDKNGYFTGLIDIHLGNIFGTGRSISTHWEKRDRNSQDLKLHYLEPWVANLPAHIGVGFEQLIQDTTYIQRDFNLNLTIPLVESFNFVSQINQNSILPDSASSYLLAVPRSKTFSYTLGITYDSRDDKLNPTHGIYYATSVEQGKKKNLGPADLIAAYDLQKKIDNQKIYLDTEFYIPTFKRQVLSLALHGRQIKSDEAFIPLPDQFRLGGTRTLRGYREDQFRGSSIAWSNLEYRYLLGRRSRAFVFADVGYFNSQTASRLIEETKLGWGFGVRLETGLGIMGIDYGLAYGEKQGLMAGLLHVGLINEF